jgi:hypothetical protein
MHRIGRANTSSELFQTTRRKQTLPCGYSLNHKNLSKEAGLVSSFNDVLSTSDIMRIQGDKKCMRFEFFTAVNFLVVVF